MQKFILGLLLLLPLSLGAMDVEIEAPFTNLFFNTDRKADGSGLKFTGEDLFWNVNAWVSHSVSDTLKVTGGYVSDVPLRRRAFFELVYKTDNFTLSVGPFYGLLNTVERWFIPGIMADFRMDFPGVAYLDLGFQASFSPVAKPGDYSINGQKITLGFFPNPTNGIVALSAEYNEFLKQEDSMATVQDDRLAFSLITEVFVKNFPIRFQSNLKYQILNRNYFNVVNPLNTTARIDKKTPLHSFLVGLKTTWEVTPTMAFYLNSDISLFSFGINDTNYNVANWLPLYSVSIGTKFSLDPPQQGDTSQPLPVPEVQPNAPQDANQPTEGEGL